MKISFSATMTVYLFLFTFVLITPTFSQKVEHQTRIVTEDELRKIQLECAKAEATPVQKVSMSKQQKEDSKLFKDYRFGKTIRARLSECDDEYIAFGRNVASPAGMPGEGNTLTSIYFQELAEKADAIVLGQIKKKSSFLTEDDDFIFTEYELNPTEVLKENASNPIKNKCKIVLTRPGGSVLIDNRVVEAIDEANRPLKRGGRYIIFLRFIPTTGSYQAINSHSTFYLNNGLVEAMTGENSSTETPKVTDFIEIIKSAVALTSK